MLKTTRERTLPDGTVQALQMEMEPGKRPVPKGWVTIRKGPAPPRGAAAAVQRKPRKTATPKTESTSSTTSSDGDDVLGWVLGALATSALILGVAYILINRT
jgi:hypothetical protein